MTIFFKFMNFRYPQGIVNNVGFIVSTIFPREW